MTIYIVIIILIIIFFLTILILNNYYKLKYLDIAIELCQTKLNEILNQKKNLLVKIKSDSKNQNIIEAINIEENLDIFQLEKELFDARWSLKKIIDEKKYKPRKDIEKMIIQLSDIEEDIEGLKDYYNSKAITYNEIYLKKPFNIIYKILKYNQKKIFALRKLEDYE